MHTNKFGTGESAAFGEVTGSSYHLTVNNPMAAMTATNEMNMADSHTVNPDDSHEIQDFSVGARACYDADPQSIEPAPVDTYAQVDSNSSDADSAIDDINPPSSTASLTESMYENIVLHGRTYHSYKNGNYIIPNDETEQNRLDLQHHLSLLTLYDQLHLAPIKQDLHHALDIATGTGNWAIDFAIRYPSCHVIGCDLSPIQPHYVPPNCHFEVDDVEDEWQYHYKFDFIHGRYLALCFKDPLSVFRRAYDALTPGGYFEMQDSLTLTCIDDSGERSQLIRWRNLMLEASGRLGRDWAKVTKYKDWMEAVGFEDVTERHFAWPTNTWPKGKHHKNLAILANENLKLGIEGFSVAALTGALGWNVDEVNVLMEDVKRDLDDRSIHAYLPILIIYGRKPLR